MMLADEDQRRSRQVRSTIECRFVDRDEFCELLLGFRRLVRADEPARNMRGLLDVETGTRFLIHERKLA